MIPLAYIIRTNEDVQARQLYSDAHGSIEGELIACASHTHVMHLKKRRAAHHMLLQSSPSRGPRMVMMHSWPSQINMLETTTGRWKFANKMTYFIHVCGKVN